MARRRLDRRKEGSEAQRIGGWRTGPGDDEDLKGQQRC